MHYKIALMQEGYTLKAYCKVSAQGQVAACETHTGTTIMHSGAILTKADVILTKNGLTLTFHGFAQVVRFYGGQNFLILQNSSCRVSNLWNSKQLKLFSNEL